MKFQKDYFGFVYHWTDSTNDKTYTGSHYGSIEDGYRGSGLLFLNAYKKRPDKFNREILEYVYQDNKKLLLEIEQKYLDKIDWSNTYNISADANGGNTRAGYTKKQLKKYHQKLSNPSEQTRQKISEFRKGKIPWNKGISITEERRKNISESLKGKPWSAARRLAQEMRSAQNGDVL